MPSQSRIAADAACARNDVDASAAQGAGAASAALVPPARAWASLAILLVLSTVSILDRQIIALMVGPIKRGLQLSDTELGLLQGFAFAIFYSLASLPIGWAIDRYSRRAIVYLSVTAWSLSAASCGLAGQFWQLFLGRMAVGVGEASLTPASVSLIGDIFPSRKVGLPLGIYAAGFYLGSGVALGIGGLIVGQFAGVDYVVLPFVGDVASWQAIFFLTGLPGVALALLAFLLADPRRSARKAATSREHGIRIGRYLEESWRVVFHSFVGFGLATLVAYAMGAWTPAYLARAFGWKATEIGWAWGLTVAFSGALGAVLGGSMIDRAGQRGVRDACLLVPAIASLIAWPLVTAGYLVADPRLALVLIGAGLIALGVVSGGSFATWRRIAPPALRGRVTAGFVLVSSLIGAGTGPAIVALATDYLFGNESYVGRSLALTVAIALPAMAFFLFLGRSACALHPSPEGPASTSCAPSAVDQE